MAQDAFCFRFNTSTDFAEIRDTLLLAVLAAEAVHGAASVKLEAGVELDEVARTCTVNATTTAGITVARIITGLLEHQVGAGGFVVERVADVPPMPIALLQRGGHA